MIIDFIIEDLMLNSYLQKNFHTLGYTGTNSRSYVYTTPNPPSNPYCEAILTATDEKGDEYAVWKGTLRDAK